MKIKQTAPLILLAFIWGCYYVASQKAVSEMSVFTVGIVIRFITMLLLTAIMIKRHEIKLLVKTKGILLRLIIIGVLGFSLDLTAFIGLSLSHAGAGTALLKCDIIFVNLMSVIIYKEKFTKLDWTYTFIMLFGVLMVMGIDFSKFKIGNRADIFFILSALFVSINAFVIKSVQLHKKNPAADNVVAFYNNFITMILFIVTSVIMGTIGQLGLLAVNRPLLIAALAAGLGQTFIYIVYYYNLRRYPVWIVKVFLLLMPIVATIVAFLLFGDVMVTGQYIGMAIVLAGAFGILIEQKKKAEMHKIN
ncbi:MAG: DMT(drug/metabolite transporter) superfamily permease [Eubacterium sp.]|nr:DMT(drug/metabolite transporter) superfamily permease [Eubacterium sp.]